MLTLSRRNGEIIVVQTPAGDIRIAVTECDRGRCRVGIDAPKEFPVWREEMLERIAAEGIERQRTHL
jgi:carbon storage regulator CsrA